MRHQILKINSLGLHTKKNVNLSHEESTGKKRSSTATAIVPLLNVCGAGLKLFA